MEIGNDILFRSNVTIRVGDHHTFVVGEFWAHGDNKKETDDQNVLIEDDVCGGTGANFSKGVQLEGV